MLLITSLAWFAHFIPYNLMKIGRFISNRFLCGSLRHTQTHTRMRARVRATHIKHTYAQILACIHTQVRIQADMSGY